MNEQSDSTEKTMTVSSETASVSPYYLHPSDNPGSMICGVQLNGENYAEWATEMEIALQAKRKTGFINGALSRPVDKPEELESWKTVNSMLVGWIRASISPKICSTVTFTPEAHKLWVDLKKRFSVGNVVRVYQLKAELAACRQDGLSVMDYYGKLSAKWDELSNYKTLWTCSCDAAEKYAKEIEEERIHQFLFGLDESRFGNVCTNIIGMEPMPELTQVYQRVIREERRLNSARVEPKQEAVGFISKADSVPMAQLTSGGPLFAAVARGRDGSGSITCFHCGRRGHEKKDCWQLIGFPEWWSEKYQGVGGCGAAGRGTSGGRGFPQGRGRGGARVNVAQAHAVSPLPGFTSEQWAALSQHFEHKSAVANLIPERLQGKEQTGDVIIDTGASHNMTCDEKLLTSLRIISACPISFADGSQVFASCSGTLPFSDRIILENVLLVPNLNCILLSVSKLLKQTGCFALFTNTLCVLQDRFSKTLIGAGEERDGVYVYRDVASAKVHTVNAVEDSTLWHRRLGHPSSQVLSFLPNVFGVKRSHERFDGCEICFKSKQTCEVFFDSNNKVSDCFSLIHVDVWGPYRIPSSCGAIYFFNYS